MKSLPMRHWFLSFIYLLALGLLPTLACADNELLVEDSIRITDRPVDEVIVLLEPFLDPQGILAGQGEELYIKTTRENMKVLKEELRRLSPNLAQLRVYVTMNPTIVEAARQGRSVASTARGGSDIYFIDTTEGQWATINISTQYPVRQRFRTERGTITERVMMQGYSAHLKILPELKDGKVILYVRAAGSDEGGSIDTENTLIGEPGSWIYLAGTGVPGDGHTITTTREGVRAQLAVRIEKIESQ